MAAQGPSRPALDQGPGDRGRRACLSVGGPLPGTPATRAGFSGPLAAIGPEGSRRPGLGPRERQSGTPRFGRGEVRIPERGEVHRHVSRAATRPPAASTRTTQGRQGRKRRHHRQRTMALLAALKIDRHTYAEGRMVTSRKNAEGPSSRSYRRRRPGRRSRATSPDFTRWIEMVKRGRTRRNLRIGVGPAQGHRSKAAALRRMGVEVGARRRSRTNRRRPLRAGQKVRGRLSPKTTGAADLGTSYRIMRGVLHDEGEPDLATAPRPHTSTPIANVGTAARHQLAATTQAGVLLRGS